MKHKIEKASILIITACLLNGCSFMLRSTQGELPDETVTSSPIVPVSIPSATDDIAAQMEKTRKETQIIAGSVIGLTEVHAQELIAKSKTSSGEYMSARIGRRDKENFILTMDYRPSRITLDIDNGVVTKAVVG